MFACIPASVQSYRSYTLICQIQHSDQLQTVTTTCTYVELAYTCSGHPPGESSLYPATTLESMTVLLSSLYGSSPVRVQMCMGSKVNIHS